MCCEQNEPVRSASLATTGHGAPSHTISVASGSDQQQGSFAVDRTASSSNVPLKRTVGLPTLTANDVQSRASGAADRPANGFAKTPGAADNSSGSSQSAENAAGESPYAALFQLPVLNGQHDGDRTQTAEAPPLPLRDTSADPVAGPADMERWVPTAPVKASAEPMRMQLERWSDQTGAARSASWIPSAQRRDRRSGGGQESTPPSGGPRLLAVPLRAGSRAGDAAPAAGSADQPSVGCKREEDAAVRPADKPPQATGDADMAVSLPLTPRLGERTVARISDFTSANTSLACARQLTQWNCNDSVFTSCSVLCRSARALLRAKRKEAHGICERISANTTAHQPL